MDKDYLGFLKGVKGLVREEEEVMGYEGEGIKPGMEAKDEKETTSPDEHTEGTGTEQAGTSDSETFGAMAGDLEDLLALEETFSMFSGETPKK
jgi:hypothetical protein